MAISTRSSGRAETALVSLILGSGAPPSVAADPFHAPPAPLPQGRPGELVRAEPTAVSLLPGCPLPATRSWHIMYRSTSATGDPMVVTGTLSHYSREEIEELIAQHGGRAAASVSKKTDLHMKNTRFSFTKKILTSFWRP